MGMFRKAIVRGASCCALAVCAVDVSAVDVHEVLRLMQQPTQRQMKQERVERLPTQPIHRSILSHRKRTLLRTNEGTGSPPRVATGRRAEDELGTPPEDASPNKNANDEDGASEPQDEESTSPAEPTPPLLTSEWWVRISEEVGRNSWNFVPESRRAASSVIFTYKYSKERMLEENANNNATQSVGQGSEGDEVKTESEHVAGEENADANSGRVEGAAEEEEEMPTSQAEHVSEPPTPKDEGSTTNAEEYIVISGGYTDHDWKTFPVYAFPITSAIRTLSGQWIDLSPSMELGEGTESHCLEEDGVAARDKLYTEAQYREAKDGSDIDDPWEKAQNCAPTGRMGHQSFVHDGKLYVVGGLIYDEEQSGRKETFRLEDVPFVYRLDLNEMFEYRRAESEGRGSNQKVTGWQRIIPSVKPFPTPAGMSSTSAAEVLLTSVNRGEMQGGLWSADATTGGHDKFMMYGGMRIARLEYEGYGHSNDPFPKKSGPVNSFGSSTQMHSHKIVELPLGDVWAYDLEWHCWEKITNNYGRPVEDTAGGDDVEDGADAPKKLAISDDDDWWYDGDISLYPRPRTAHAATVVGHELIIHGGMGWNEHTNDWDGSTDWETLDDMWILNLNTREWRRRWLFPSLVRSYHSLVGWSMEDSTMGWGRDFGMAANFTSWEGPVVAAFGGYTTGMDVFSGEELAYVFDDLLISYPPVKKTNTSYDDPASPWLKASMPEERDGAEMISTRYEHAAVLSKEGVLVVWGGSFQNTAHIKGVWMIDIAGEESKLHLSMAEEDSIYNDYEKTINALHTIVIMLMFMSISLTLLLGLTQRYQELVQQANDDAAIAAGLGFAVQDLGNEQPARRGNGLHPEIIETLPRKIYSASENGDNGGTDGDDPDTCPICLVDYEEGDELRELPCGHAMHVSCLDAWLANHPSCPSCRHSLSELVDDRPMMQLRTLRSRLSTSPALARFLRQQQEALAEEGIEMTEELPRDAIIDFRYVSSLALAEEDGATETTGEDGEQRGDNVHVTSTPAMDELSSWRSRRRQLQRNRRVSRLAGLRSNVHVSRFRSQRPSRIPLADFDEE